MVEGFKNTEVGVIPNDWEVRSYGEVFEFLNTATYSRADTTDNDEIGYIHYGDIHTKWNFNLDISKNTIPTIPKEKLKRYSLVRDGDVVMADASEDYSGVGKSIEILNVKDRKLIAGLHTFLFRDTKGFFVNGYRSYLHTIPIVKKQFDELATGMKVYGVSKNNLKKVLIPIPTLAEQTAIATALSDADALINQLEQLLNKKRNIKTGAMQELLRPKEGWEESKLTDECELITKGTTPTSVGRAFQISGINFIKIESLTESGKIIKDKVAFIDDFTNHLLKRSQLKSGDALFSIAGALGRVALVSDELLPANTNQALAIIRLKKDSIVKLKYLFYYLNGRKIQNHVLAINVQGAQSNLSLLNIAEFPIHHPNEIEQTRIAQILSDMDNEIEELEKQLDKYKMLKQGMMQNLLTGKIRLV